MVHAVDDVVADAAAELFGMAMFCQAALAAQGLPTARPDQARVRRDMTAPVTPEPCFFRLRADISY